MTKEREENFEDNTPRDLEQELLELQDEISTSIRGWRKRWIDATVIALVAVVVIGYLFSLSVILGLVVLVAALWFGLPRIAMLLPSSPLFTFDVTGKRLLEFFLVEEINYKNVGYPPTIGGGWARATCGFRYNKVSDDDLIINDETVKEESKSNKEPRSRRVLESKLSAVLHYKENPGRYIYTDKNNGFSISFPERWIVSGTNETVRQMMSVAEKDKGGDNFPFLFIFFEDFFRSYKDDGQMGPNVSIGKVKLKASDPHEDFDLQLAELPNTILGYHEVNHGFDDKKSIGKVEMTSTIGDMKFRMVQHYHYPGNSNPIVLTFPPSSERQGTPSEEMDSIVSSFQLK